MGGLFPSVPFPLRLPSWWSGSAAPSRSGSGGKTPYLRIGPNFFFEIAYAISCILVHYYADSLWMNLRYAIDGCLSVCMSVCMYVTKCIATKLQMLQTFPLAQIYPLTIEIDLPSDVDKFRYFGRRPPSWISEDQYLKMLKLLNRLRYRLQTGVILLIPAAF
jgi:hypothetical protein